MDNIFKYELLREKRKGMNLSQEVVADYLGLTRNSIINMEKGRHNPTLDGVYKLCCLYNIPPNDLFPPINKKRITTKTVKITKTKKVKHII